MFRSFVISAILKYVKTLIYSFRTFPRTAEIKNKTGCEVFIFGRLKEDLERFKEIILKEKPDTILGIAKISTKSRVEQTAINQFGLNKKVTQGGKETYNLFIPKTNFQIAKRPTYSFCNWTMYKIASFLSTESPNTKLSFIHLNLDDINELPRT